MSQNRVSDSKVTLLGRSKKTYLLTLVVLFLMAIGVRIYGACNHPVGFHYPRQYHSALLSRHFYYQGLEAVPEWKKSVIQVTTPNILEPPVMEWLAAFGYHAVGGEQLWIPRMLASLFWIVGGMALYALLRRFFDRKVALLSTAFYLFVPYGIFLSRSFQPDSLMVMMMLFSLFAIVRFHEKTNMNRLLTAAIMSGLALLIKPVAAFLIFGAFISLALLREHPGRLILDRFCWLFCLIAVAPAAVYYIYQIVGGGDLAGVAQISILPSLLVHLFYYKGWLYKLETVVGFPALVASLVGTLMFVRRDGRFLALGLWVGYVIFGLVFTWPFMNLAHYHIVLIPIIAFCLGPLLEKVMESLRSQSLWFVRPAFFGILVFLIVITIKPIIGSIQQSNYLKTVAFAQEIGKIVKHSTKTIFLAPDWGNPLMYHGWLGGKLWPNSWILRIEKLGITKMHVFQKLNPQPNMQAVKKRFEHYYKSNKFEYFIVTDIKEFERQLNLKGFLTANFDLLADTKDYLIFDLRSKKEL